MISTKQHLIDQLQTIILQTITLIDRFEHKEMQDLMSADYAQLHEILDNSIKQQRELQKQLITETANKP